MKNTPEAIGKRIAELRRERGLSQRQLAGTEMSAAYVSRVENGARNPSGKSLKYFARALGTTVEYLETGVKAVTTLTLDEYVPYLLEVGCDPDKLDADEIERLGKFTHEVLSRGTEDHPLRRACEVLKRDNDLRRDSTSILFDG